MSVYYQGLDGSIHFLGDPNYLEHHGVQGMKWGVRKNPYRDLNRLHRVDQNANKALIRSGKLQAKSARKRRKANKMMAKAMKKGDSKYDKKARKLNNQADKLAVEAGKQMFGGFLYDRTHPTYTGQNAKARRLAKKINKRYQNVSVTDLDQNQIFIGRKYAIQFVG